MPTSVAREGLHNRLVQLGFKPDAKHGRNERGMSVRHPDLPDPVLVCHFDFNDQDMATGFYFNCVKSVAQARLTAGKRLSALLVNVRLERKGAYTYAAADFVDVATIDDMCELATLCLRFHPKK